MNFNVYLILTKRNKRYITYVGYTKDIKKRLILHNKSKGAKFTRGNYWKVIYKKKYLTKQLAMKAEYKLKKNFKLRNSLKQKYLNNENCSITSL